MNSSNSAPPPPLSENAKKLAAQARNGESNTVDMQNVNQTQAQQFVNFAFQTPIQAKNMLKITLIVGGGKKVRQKYDEKLPHYLSEALKNINFTEDRAASAVLNCQATFKFQHDTDKDLKFVHVFPKVDIHSNDERNPHDVMSPDQLVVYSDAAAYQLMLSRKTQSFSQRRRALQVLREARQRVQDIEAKMTALENVDDTDSTFYESVDAETLTRKIEFTSKVLDGMITKAQLTKNEQREVIDQLARKIIDIDLQLDHAREQGKEKRVAKLEQMRLELDSRRTLVAAAQPVVHKPKFEAEIRAARKKLAELEKLESHKGILPLETVQKLSAKPKLLADLAVMESESAGWFNE